METHKHHYHTDQTVLIQAITAQHRAQYNGIQQNITHDVVLKWKLSQKICCILAKRI